MTTPRIDVTDVTVEGSETVCVSLTPSAAMRRFINDCEFRVHYGVDVDDVPESVLVIPALSQIATVAWTRGATVSVESVDEPFQRALEDVKAALMEMYPSFIRGGRITADRSVESTPTATSGSALLFSGGVDSTSSYVRHRDEDPVLVAVRGWTIGLEECYDETWNRYRDHVERFASARNLDAVFLETNLFSVLDHPMLLSHFKRYVDGCWYSSVGHGLGLLGLCAPLTYARGIETCYIAATHWEGVDLEWGSRPDIDEHVRWSGTRCVHDGYERTRQERLDEIAAYVRGTDRELELLTCSARPEKNCGNCEKCYRTAVGLRLSGLDPTDHGYSFSSECYRSIRRGFERGEWILGEDEYLMWSDIRDRIAVTEPTDAAEAAFFEWILDTELETHLARGTPPFSHRLVRMGARHTPTPVYRRLYPTYQTARDAVGHVTERR